MILKQKDYPQKQHSTMRRPMIITGVCTLVLALLVAAALGLLAYQADKIGKHLSLSVSLIDTLQNELENDNGLHTQEIVTKIQGETLAARSIATGPLWRVASATPIVGPNFRAVSEVAVSANDVADHAIVPLVNRLDSFDWSAFSPVNGQIDLTRIQDIAPTVSSAASTVRLSHERMRDIDLSNLIPEVAEPLRSATAQLSGAAEVLETASAATELLPQMLGADSNRNYLVLIQNNSEARATGGIPGALAVLGTDAGKISLKEQDSASGLGSFRPPIEVDAEQVALFTPRIGTQMQNVNLTPQFSTVAKTAMNMWQTRHNNQRIDGVLALDPIVLSHLLHATGPVTLTDSGVLSSIQNTSLPSALTAHNVVPTLLSDVYREIEDPKAQDIYFAAVATSIFNAFSSGDAEPGQMLKALSTSVEEGRLLLWSSHDSEQKVIASTKLHGSVTGPDAGGLSFGAYFNDGTGAKMDYYVTRTVQVIQACSVDEYGQYYVRITATNNAPADAASSLPAYVTGDGVFGVEPGRIRTNYVAYGPAQALVDTATVGGQPVPVSSGKHGQRPVSTVSLELGPGETGVIDIGFSGVVQDSEPQLRVTPTTQAPRDVIRPFEREACG